MLTNDIAGHSLVDFFPPLFLKGDSFCKLLVGGGCRGRGKGINSFLIQKGGKTF